MQEKMLWGGAPRAGQVFSHAVLQMQNVQLLFSPGWFLFQGRCLLLYWWLPEKFWDQMCRLPRLRRGRSKIYRLPSVIVFLLKYLSWKVVSALGKTYHQKCFTCARCRQPFPSGEKVTYTGKEVLCQKCVHIPVRAGGTPQTSPSAANPNGMFNSLFISIINLWSV